MLGRLTRLSPSFFSSDFRNFFLVLGAKRASEGGDLCSFGTKRFGFLGFFFFLIIFLFFASWFVFVYAEWHFGLSGSRSRGREVLLLGLN